MYFAPPGGENLAQVLPSLDLVHVGCRPTGLLQVLLRADAVLAFLHRRFRNKRVLMVCHGELMLSICGPLESDSKD